MTIVKTKKFFCDETQYETRVALKGNDYVVQVFCQGRRATPYTYLVDSDYVGDGYLYSGKKLCDHLMEIAESDTRAKPWINEQEETNKFQQPPH